jgi:hypothetical protein
MRCISMMDGNTGVASVNAHVMVDMDLQPECAHQRGTPVHFVDDVWS